ncbi:MAG: DUF389 domain-containing protein [Pseudomonadota bacterium]
MGDAEEEKPALVRAALLIRDEEHPAIEAARAFASAQGIELEEIGPQALLDATPGRPMQQHWVLAVGDERVAGLVALAAGKEVALGLLPAAGSVLPRLFDLPKTVDAQLALAFSDGAVALDITRCNDEPVLGFVAIGDVPFLDARGRALVRAQPTRWRRWRIAAAVYWNAIRRLFSIRPSAVRLRIGDEEKPRRSAVTGIVVVENDAEKLGGQLMGEHLSARDGRLSALLVAPTSVAAYLAALGREMFGPGRGMPRAFSVVKTRRLTIESAEPLSYRIDGRRRSAERIEFAVTAAALKVKTGPGFADDNPVAADERDTLRLKTLPENEARLALISSRLPLFTHALEEDFKELFLLLRESARVTPDYVILTLASTLLAALGLVLGSAAVIIGAMVLAPLMAPIVSLAMSLLRRDPRLLRAAAKTIAVGVALALAASALLALVTPLRRLTPEIEARLHPTLLDLGVAVVSGVAAAYAYARESVVKSLPGVAIAVALVPPLAVAGIGLGWGDARLFGGAALLFLTNLVGIASTAALTFLVLGYAPIQTAARGLRMLAAALVALALPLYFSFDRIVEVWRLERQLQRAVLSTGQREVQLREPRVAIEDGRVVVAATVVAPELLGTAEIDALKDELERRVQREVRVELDLRVVR